MTALELWKIFDEECGKLGYVALTFGKGITGHGHEGPPGDLTVWENVLKRIEPPKSRFAVDIVIDPTTGEPVEKKA